jgi:hypothetical protein
MDPAERPVLAVPAARGEEVSQGPQTPRTLAHRVRNLEKKTRDRSTTFAAPITAWEDMDLPLLNAWVPFGAPYAPPGFYKDHSGVVHLRGVMKNGDVGGIFQMDPGYLPEVRSIHMALGAGLAIARIDILLDGTVHMGGFTDNSLISLDGIRWRAAS